MRFCPFCAQENSDEGAECAHCGRRLPVLSATSTTMGVRALPRAHSVRPPPPVRRPLPRARPVTPSAALVKPAVIAPSVAAPSPEAHKRTPTGTLLGVATIPEAKLPIEGEGATRIEASPFDRSAVPSPVTLELTPVPDQTAPTERFEEPPTDVSIRRPAPNIEEDLTDVRRQRSSSDEGPTHVQQPSPFARNDGKLPSRPSLPSLPSARPCRIRQRRPHLAPAWQAFRQRRSGGRICVRSCVQRYGHTERLSTKGQQREGTRERSQFSIS